MASDLLCSLTKQESGMESWNRMRQIVFING
jgi:hypothetical protein